MGCQIRAHRTLRSSLFNELYERVHRQRMIETRIEPVLVSRQPSRIFSNYSRAELDSKCHVRNRLRKLAAVLRFLHDARSVTIIPSFHFEIRLTHFFFKKQYR